MQRFVGYFSYQEAKLHTELYVVSLVLRSKVPRSQGHTPARWDSGSLSTDIPESRILEDPFMQFSQLRR